MINDVIATNPTFFIVLLVLFSLAIGSLLNVIIYRLPIMLHQDFIEECKLYLNQPFDKKSNINLFFPRSFCQNCKTLVSSWQNIPIVSYIFLRGKCKSCGKTISLRYPLIEALTTILSLFTIWHFGFTVILPFALIFVWVLIVLFFIDFDHQILPDCLTLSLLWLGLLANVYTHFIPLEIAVLSAVIGYLSLWIFNRVFYLISGKIGMGNGDFKLFAAIGAWVGWQQLPLVIFASSFLGAIIGIAYLKISRNSRNTPIPFGPFLCITGFFSFFWGQPIINFYLSYFI